MASAKQVFEALPHVQEVWITKDGHHHLHPHYGGEKVVRGEEIIIEKKAEAKVNATKNK